VTDISATLAERGKSYGSFADRCEIEQGIKDAFRAGCQWDVMPADCRCALEMIATKISRIVAGQNAEHYDSWHDIAGYAQLVAERLEPR
jgi:hypothetical protein